MSNAFTKATLNTALFIASLACAQSHTAPVDAGPCTTQLIVSRREAICVDEVTVCPAGQVRVCAERPATITQCNGSCDLAGPWTSLPTQPHERCHAPDPCGRNRTHHCVPEECVP